MGENRPRRQAQKCDSVIRKRIEFDAETWHALRLLAGDSMKSLQELAEEAFADLLKKHGRSADFREQLKLSVRAAKKK